MAEKAKMAAPKNPEICYSIKELAESGFLNCPPECVYAAFKEKNMVKASKEAATKIVKNFLSREVK